MNSFWIPILVGAVAILQSCSCEKRLIEYAAPWQPVAIPAAAPQLISIGNFDATNKAQIAQIAHHNAQILRQIKGLHPPVTQYLNPFPVFPSANSPKVVMTANSLPTHIYPSSGTLHHLAPSPSVKQTIDKFPTTQNLLSSSSNVAQTVMPQTIMKSYLGSKPTFIAKPDLSQLKYFNGISTTSKVPSIFLNSASSSMPSFQMFTTTSRVPLLRDVTLTSPSSLFKSTQLPYPVAGKYSMAMSAGSRPAASNQVPGQIISSYTHFGPAAQQIIRGEPKQRIRANFLTAPFEHYQFGGPYAGHLTPTGHFVAKNNYQNSLYFPHNGHGSYQLTSTFVSSPQKPNSEALRFVNSPNQVVQNMQSQQHLQGPQPPEPQPSYLPSLPTVPPSVLSPFFQVQQHHQTQDNNVIPPPLIGNQLPDNGLHSNTFHLLNDEYTINLVPPPPYKHTDSTKFRPRPPAPTTPTAPTSLSVSGTNSTPVGPPVDYFDDHEQQKAMEILNKYNIPAISPLQDANRYSYHGFGSAVTSTTQPTPSYSDDQIFKKWPHDNNSPSFTTEKPNIFKNLNRPSESEYHQHKVMHPGYTGARRPLTPTTTPFVPTSDSLNNAITHSFFTIEDAITLSPHHHYRRPVKPTNTNEIEANLRKPTNDIYTESASTDPFADFEKEQDYNGEYVTASTPPATSTLRPRNKLRRKRPRPTTESTSTTVDSEINQIKLEADETPMFVESATDLPKNHKEYSNTRERGPPIQFTRETTSESPRESSTNGYRNRVRNRTRLPITSAETSTTSPSLRPKRPYSAENRRPNNRFEDNKVQRQRPQAEKSTRYPFEESEQTTIGQSTRETYNRPSRRPYTTQQAIPVSTTSQEAATDGRVTESDEFSFETRAPTRLRNSSPSTITTSSLTPTIDNAIVDTTQGRPEENPVILSTRLNVSNEPGSSTSQPESSSVEDEELEEEVKTSEPQTQEITSASSTSTSSSSTSTTSTSTTSEKTDFTKESMITSDGPVYIRDDNSKLEMSNFRTRQRMRNKEKILEAVAAATSSQTKTITKDRGHGYAHHNEVTDTESESSSTEKDSRTRLRLPVYKPNNKATGDELSANATKTIRLNGVNKFDPKNRPRFSIKEYRQRMSSSTTTPTPELASSNIVSTTASYTRLRFPTRQRVLPSELKNKTQESNKIDEKPNIIYPEKPTVETSSEQSSEVTRKRFVPKDRYSSRVKTTTELSSGENQTIPAATSTISVSTVKPPLRRSSTRRDFLTNRTRSSSTTEFPSENIVSRIPVIRNNTIPLRRPNTPSLRQRIQNQKKKDPTTTLTAEESLNDLAVEGTSEDKVRMSSNEVIPSSSTEEYKHETAIMKIAKDDHSYRPYKEKTTTGKPLTSSVSDAENDLNDSPSEQSERVAELTIFGSNQFSSVNTGGASRRVPGYFTLATEDPILPIEAFFPQVKRN